MTHAKGFTGKRFMPISVTRIVVVEQSMRVVKDIAVGMGQSVFVSIVQRLPNYSTGYLSS